MNGMSRDCGWCTVTDNLREEAGVVLGGSETHVFRIFVIRFTSVEAIAAGYRAIF